jgi:hypothetical protein
MLAVNFPHFFFVRSYPDGSSGFELDILGKIVLDSQPQLLRITGQRELSVRVVHRDNVAHACCRSTAAHSSDFYDGYPQTSLRALQSTRRADNSCADDYNIESLRHQWLETIS